jgi:hypothetical protein
MKTILLLLMTVSLTAAQKPVIQKNRQVLLDFRAERKAAPSAIPAATQKNVLSKVFRKYLTDDSKCNSQFIASDGADPLAAARKAGQIVPSITDMATGSFTAAGQSQTLYVISVSECNASHADNYGTKRVAIFSGQQLIADLDVDFKNGIARKTDLNSDGIDELLMTSGDMGQGTLIEMAALLSFQNGRLRVIHEFGTVVEDSCASGIPGSSSKASVLYISDLMLGQMPKLSMDNYSASCRNTKRWRFVSTGKMS